MFYLVHERLKQTERVERGTKPTTPIFVPIFNAYIMVLFFFPPSHGFEVSNIFFYFMWICFHRSPNKQTNLLTAAAKQIER